MVNNTVKKSKPADINEQTKIVGTEIKQKERELETKGTVDRPTVQLVAGEFVSIKAYPGGNPNKARKNEEITH